MSSKQKVVANLTSESENIVASEAEMELTWLKNLIDDLGVVPNIKEPLKIFCDNEGVVAFTKESKEHGNSINILRKYHYFQHRVEDGDIIVNHVSSNENRVKPFMKPLSREKHDGHDRKIGMKLDNDVV